MGNLMKLCTNVFKLNTPLIYAGIPELFREYVSILDVGEGPPASLKNKLVEISGSDKLSRKEALLDLEELMFYVTQVYSGKRYFEKGGYDFFKAFLRLKKEIRQYSMLSVGELGKIIFEELSTGIKDRHFLITVPGDRSYVLGKTKQAYFTDLIVEEVDGVLKVLKSSVEMVWPGAVVSCEPTYLFPTLSPLGRKFYLVGTRSYHPVESIPIRINEIYYKLAVHKCRASETRRFGRALFEREDKGEIKVVNSDSFALDADVKPGFARKIGESLKDSRCVVWNMLSNTGGAASYPKAFIEGLNGYAQSTWSMAWLKTPYTDFEHMKDWYREWEFKMESNYDYAQGNYEGALLVLVNSKTASIAEMGVGYAKSIRNHFLIGENTCGMGTFGEQMSYRLTNSGIEITLGCKIYLGNMKEGEGYEPDFWVDNMNIREEVISWLELGPAYEPTWMK